VAIRAARVADPPLNLINIPGITTAYQIGIEWIDGVYDGGSPVLDYQISYAISGDSLQIFASGTIEQHEIVNLLTPGVSYDFVVQSRNLVGFSPYSDMITILAA
jgi:hypothetical protein